MTDEKEKQVVEDMNNKAKALADDVVTSIEVHQLEFKLDQDGDEEIKRPKLSESK